MENKQLDYLLTYTTFHIGVYISLVTALIGAGIFGSKVSQWFLRFPITCFFIAGLCGAVVGSNIPVFSSFKKYSEADIGFWNRAFCSYRFWVNAEHAAFWAGILWLTIAYLSAGSVLFYRKQPFRIKSFFNSIVRNDTARLLILLIITVILPIAIFLFTFLRWCNPNPLSAPLYFPQ